MLGMYCAPHWAWPLASSSLAVLLLVNAGYSIFLTFGSPGLPVVRVGGVGDVGGGAGVHLVGAGADRVGVGVGDRVGDLRPDGLGHDRHLVGDVVEPRHGGGAEVHRDLVGAGRGDAGQDRPDAGEVEGRVLLEQVERVRHVVGGQRGAVAELDARADCERERLVPRAPAVGGREHGRDLAVLQRVDVVERLVDEPDRQQRVGAVERAEVAGPEGAVLVRDRQGGGLGGGAAAA